MNDRARLDAIMRDVLELEPGTDLSTVRYRDTVTWDSVAHVEILIAIEDAFGLQIDGEDASKLLDYAAICDLVERARPESGGQQVPAGSGVDG
jgi:acyl carrier protein